MDCKKAGGVDRAPLNLDSHRKLRNSPAMFGPHSSAHPMKPMRWVAHLPLVILPVLAAAAIQGPFLRSALTRDVTAALAASGQEWARVVLHGRDVELWGKPPGRAAVTEARAAAAAVWGVRQVTLRTGSGL